MCDRRINNGIPNIDAALQTLVHAGIMNSPEYWKNIAEKMPVKFIDSLIINMANKCRIIFEKIIYAESQGEGLEGQEYVANVIMNRAKDSRFPNGIYPVVFAQNQFTPVANGAYAKANPSASVKQAVTNVLNGKDASMGALFFRTIKGATPDCWHERALTKLFDHKNHRFYK